MRGRTSLLLAAGVLLAGPGNWSVPVMAMPLVGDDESQPTCQVDAIPGSGSSGSAPTDVNPVHDRMGVGPAQELATGRGVKVAVLDSGVAQVRGLAPAQLPASPGVAGGLLSGHGTIVASLIAGEHGVAPDAEVHDVRVYDRADADPAQGQKPVTSGAILAGVQQVLAADDRLDFDVVNISLSVRDNDERLEQAIAELIERDIVVVAAAGNRLPEDRGEDRKGTPRSDAEVYPADYDGVLAVSTVPPAGVDPGEWVMPNRDTDVALPTVGAVAMNATGEPCLIGEPATSWAAAEVSGVVALLRERFPDDTARQTMARLMATTEGGGLDPEAPARPGDANPWTGAGVVLAHEALTRELDLDREGQVDRSVVSTEAGTEAPPAPGEVDLFGSSRALLLWFGLAAGALMALAWLVRPLVRPTGHTRVPGRRT